MKSTLVCHALSVAGIITFTQLPLGSIYGAYADVSIDSNGFANNTGKIETDFHMFIAGHFTGKPKSDKMPNVSTTDGKPFAGNNTVDFSGGSVGVGDKLNVTFEATGKTNKPMGYFTPDGDPSKLLPSIAANGTTVAFVPLVGGAYDATVSIVNTDFDLLTGSLTVYVNNGFGNFNIDDFQTLSGAVVVDSIPTYSLGLNEGIFGITAHLSSLDQYILITGTADGDGSGLSPFAFAFSPAAVPEPSTWAMLLLGFWGLGFAGYRKAKSLTW